MKCSTIYGYRSFLAVLLFSIIVMFYTSGHGSSNLLYSSLLSGGIDTSQGNAIAADNLGNIYVTGYEASPHFPVTAGAVDSTNSNNLRNVFVSKINPNLSGNASLVYSTLLGGEGNDGGYGIAVDSSGNIYVTGYTESSTFPVTANGYETTSNGGDHVFVTVLNPSLSGSSSLIYSTYIAGNNSEYSYALALDSNRKMYITGVTGSSNYPTTPNAYNTSFTGGADMFITVINPSLSGASSLIYSTYLGGFGYDLSDGIAVSTSGKIFVTGYTQSSTSFPVTTNAYNTTFNGVEDVFVTEIDPTISGSSALLYSTLLGGHEPGYNDSGKSIAVDLAGNVAVTGYTRDSAFPITTNGYTTTYQGSGKVFVTKINPTLSGQSSLIYSTYLGGNSGEAGAGIAMDTAGNMYVAGYSFSSNFPTTSDAISTTYKGQDDVFVCKINPTLSGRSSLVYSTLLGGVSYEAGFAIALDTSENIYVTGFTLSPGFPYTSNAYDTVYQGDGNYDYSTFVSKIQIGTAVSVNDWMMYGKEVDNFKE